MLKKKLGEVLQERGQISPADLAKAIADQHGKVIHLGELMLDRGLVGRAELASALAEVVRVPFVDCAAVKPTPEALRMIPKTVALKCCVLPLGVQNSTLSIAMAEPQNLAIVDEIRFVAGINIAPRLGFRADIAAAIEQNYGKATKPTTEDPWNGGSEEPEEPEEHGTGKGIEFVSTSSRQANREAIQEVQAELMHKRTPAVRVVSEIIGAAVDKRASDIHIEPQASGLIVRVRVDGLLRDLRREPRALQNALVSRIKILADMDISERRAPQDGRFLVRLHGRQIDLRVSTLPTQYGEKVVMRLLDSAGALLNLSELKMPKQVESALRDVLSLPQGMLLVTGPTGSGKSTTLYASLNLLRQPAANIVTVEDPVEYVLPGINQVLVNNKAGLTFASCLRSILRQDPNVIMVGEIRDRETAEIAMKAAQTGHLVLSTLHTNDSLSAVTRLIDLGVAGFMIASSVSAVLAQRLVRRLCSCRRKIPVSGETADRLAAVGISRAIEDLWVPAGCELCDQTGFRGRIGVYEMLVLDDAIRQAIRDEQKGDSLRSLAQNSGLKLMQEDACDKIVEGITSLEEVMRVVPVQNAEASRCPSCGGRTNLSFAYCPLCGARQKPIAKDHRIFGVRRMPEIVSKQ